MSLQDGRDLVIVIAGVLSIILILVMLVAAIVLTVAARMLIATANGLLKDEVKPLIKNVRGTATYVTDTVVAPFIRINSAVARTRRFVSVLTHLGGRRR